MKEEQRVFLQIVQDFIFGNKTATPKEYDEIIKNAKKQNLEGIIYYQTRIDTLQKNYYASIIRYKQLLFAQNEINKCLDSEKIEYYFIKGLKIAETYPIPQLRTMSDIDIIIHKEDNKNIQQILEDLGYTYISENEHEIVYKKNSIIA